VFLDVIVPSTGLSSMEAILMLILLLVSCTVHRTRVGNKVSTILCGRKS